MSENGACVAHLPAALAGGRAAAADLAVWFEAKADFGAYGDLLAWARRARHELQSQSVHGAWSEFAPWLDALIEGLAAAYDLPASQAWPAAERDLLLPLRSAKLVGWQEVLIKVAATTTVVSDPTLIAKGPVMTSETTDMIAASAQAEALPSPPPPAKPWQPPDASKWRGHG